MLISLMLCDIRLRKSDIMIISKRHSSVTCCSVQKFFNDRDVIFCLQNVIDHKYS